MSTSDPPLLPAGVSYEPIPVSPVSSFLTFAARKRKLSLTLTAGRAIGMFT